MVLREPHSMVAVAAVVADTVAEAERLTLPNSLQFVRMRKGERPSRIPTLAEAEAYPWTESEIAWVAERNSQQAIGDLDRARAGIDDLVASTGADEVILVPQGPDLATKVRTLRELAG
jgi:alkanesulfonate monooxygenase SsuD/methylene tetrahydromethanopterin reductase-like flavin-dependent oxidoreductase (luciferase family)